MLEIAAGLSFLHENGYAHRDLTSSNVLVTDQFDAKVCSPRTTSHAFDRVTQKICGPLPAEISFQSAFMNSVYFPIANGVVKLESFVCVHISHSTIACGLREIV